MKLNTVMKMKRVFPILGLLTAVSAELRAL